MHHCGRKAFPSRTNLCHCSITFSQPIMLQTIDRDWHVKITLRIYEILFGNEIKSIGRAKQTKFPETHSPSHPLIPKQI